jgi:hypothetical protein
MDHILHNPIEPGPRRRWRPTPRGRAPTSETFFAEHKMGTVEEFEAIRLVDFQLGHCSIYTHWIPRGLPNKAHFHLLPAPFFADHQKQFKPKDAIWGSCPRISLTGFRYVPGIATPPSVPPTFSTFFCAFAPRKRYPLGRLVNQWLGPLFLEAKSTKGIRNRSKMEV